MRKQEHNICKDPYDKRQSEEFHSMGPQVCNVKNLRKKPVVRLRDRIRLRKEKGLWTGTQHLNSSFNIISKP